MTTPSSPRPGEPGGADVRVIASSEVTLSNYAQSPNARIELSERQEAQLRAIDERSRSHSADG